MILHASLRDQDHQRPHLLAVRQDHRLLRRFRQEQLRLHNEPVQGPVLGQDEMVRYHQGMDQGAGKAQRMHLLRLQGEPLNGPSHTKEPGRPRERRQCRNGLPLMQFLQRGQGRL